MYVRHSGWSETELYNTVCNVNVFIAFSNNLLEFCYFTSEDKKTNAIFSLYLLYFPWL